MIDKAKWDKASEDVKMSAINVIKAVMNNKLVTKTDNEIIVEFLLGKTEKTGKE